MWLLHLNQDRCGNNWRGLYKKRGQTNEKKKRQRGNPWHNYSIKKKNINVPSRQRQPIYWNLQQHFWLQDILKPIPLVLCLETSSTQCSSKYIKRQPKAQPAVPFEKIPAGSLCGRCVISENYFYLKDSPNIKRIMWHSSICFIVWCISQWTHWSLPNTLRVFF